MAMIACMLSLTGCQAAHCFLPAPASPALRIIRQFQAVQDLQVTIEVRFISVSDNFFERIGIDFDTNVQDSLTGPVVDPFSFNLGGCSPGPIARVAPSDVTGGPDFAQYLLPSFFFGGPLPLVLPGSDALVDPVTIFPMLANNIKTNASLTDVPDLNGVAGATNLPRDATLESGFSLRWILLSDAQIDAIIQGVQQSANDDILTAPKVTLFNGQRAIVMEGSEPGAVADLEPSVEHLVHSA
ncbi:MAG: hypothetical protein V3T70_03835, partial [Phycisphaerae bacterium]